MAAGVVAKEVFKQSLRRSTKLMNCFQGCGECILAAENRCPRRVFSCGGALDFTQNVLFDRTVALLRRRHHQGVLRVSAAGHHGSECITHQECWKCGATIDPTKEQYFCGCGVVQPPIDKRSLFQVMGLEERFDIDLKVLTEKHRDLQRILHPDKYSQKSDTEKDFSIQHSSLVNRAYNMLLKPLSRGLYMLRLKEEDLENETQMDFEFLDRILEINESIIEADSPKSIEAVEAENLRVLDGLVADISKAFRSNDSALAKQLLLKLKYYVNIEDKIKDFRSRFAN